ncbi:hypothetical protein Acsp04_64750 [Actinomadura sp. NBRC 104425]|nr:hypothetical protein Acsp04_64750 [Actinomadura sp. NBRC 104425]
MSTGRPLTDDDRRRVAEARRGGGLGRSQGPTITMSSVTTATPTPIGTASSGRTAAAIPAATPTRTINNARLLRSG